MLISKILPFQPIYDPENLARETLKAKTIAWISDTVIYTDDLPNLRAMVRSLTGQSIEALERPMPSELISGTYIEWSLYTAINRRQIVMMGMGYAGIDSNNCIDLFGTQGWKDVSYAVDWRCLPPKSQTPLQLLAIDEKQVTDEVWWGVSQAVHDPATQEIAKGLAIQQSSQLARDLVTDLFLQVLTEKYISGYVVSNILKPLHVLLAAERIAPLMSDEEVKQTAEFQVLSAALIRYDDLPTRSFNALPDVLMVCLGINELILQQALGKKNAQQIQDIFTKMRSDDRNLCDGIVSTRSFFDWISDWRDRIFAPIFSPKRKWLKAAIPEAEGVLPSRLVGTDASAI